MAHVTSLSAVTLVTTKLEASTKFYDLLGATKVYADSAFVSYMIVPGTQTIIFVALITPHYQPGNNLILSLF